MSFFKKKEVTTVNLIHVNGLESYGEGTAVTLDLDDTNECLIINARVYKKSTVYLKYDQITTIKCMSEDTIKEKNKSVLGRALVGGVFIGALGAVIGGISGTGTSKTKKTTIYMIVNYKDREGELKALSFKIVGCLCWDKFIESSRKRIKQEENKEMMYL